MKNLSNHPDTERLAVAVRDVRGGPGVGEREPGQRSSLLA